MAQIRWGLQEIVTGRSQLIAQEAELKVTFNPKAVLEYRLIGHEASSFAGMLPGKPQTDLREGQSATALFEVRLAPNASGDIATAELSWYAPGPDSAAKKDPQKAAKKLELKQFASTFSKSASSLQVAAVAAEAAEVLRRSPFVRIPRTANALYRVWEMTGQVDSQVNQRPSFTEFVSFVQESTKARPARINRRP
jgi:hypothetical protein